MPLVNEFFICVDIETAGPNPSDYALLSIGACPVFEPQRSFYIELKPTSSNFTKEALGISHLSMEKLQLTGVPAKEAMQQFDTWLQSVVPENERPVFVAFNAPFDWMFINDYFHHHLGKNPFGHLALDIKALYMGIHKTSWRETSFLRIQETLGRKDSLSHNALEDAQQQAGMARILLNELKGEKHG